MMDRLKLNRCTMRGSSKTAIAIAHARAHPSALRASSCCAPSRTWAGSRPLTPHHASLARNTASTTPPTITSIFMPSASKESPGATHPLPREQRRGPNAAHDAQGRRLDEHPRNSAARRSSAHALSSTTKTTRRSRFEAWRAPSRPPRVRTARFARFQGSHAAVDAYDKILELMEDLVPQRERRRRTIQGQQGRAFWLAPGIMFAADVRNVDVDDATSRAIPAPREIYAVGNNVVRAALKDDGCAEVEQAGDGIMASFGRSVPSALWLAASMETSVSRRVAQDQPRLFARTGAHRSRRGEAVAEDGDLFGTTVQVAARVCARAEPSRILAANVVRELAAGERFLFAEHGGVVLRGFEDPRPMLRGLG